MHMQVFEIENCYGKRIWYIQMLCGHEVGTNEDVKMWLVII